MTPGSLDLTVLVLTRDEALHIARCIDSFAGTGAKFFVVDSGSTDDTVTIARSKGADVVQNPWTNYSTQFNWAIDHLPWKSEWLMRMDADEWITPDLRAELVRVLPAAASEVAAFQARRRIVFWGRWLRHGGLYPTWLIRIWRQGRGRCESLSMDEHIQVEGPCASLAHDFVDENLKDLTFWIDKHNGYATREAKAIMEGEYRERPQGLVEEALRKRRLKVEVYLRAPLFLRAVGYWGYRYVLLAGFLDGIPGLTFHFLQGLWYRFLVDAKLAERRFRG